MLVAKGYDEVVGKLKTEQAFERSYGRFFGEASDWVHNTYFNPLGPITVISEAHPLPTKIAQALEQIAQFKEAFNQLSETLEKEPSEKGPKSEVGVTPPFVKKQKLRRCVTSGSRLNVQFFTN
jgi:hypothetical protein